MSAKYSYFGVGGSIPAWTDFVESKRKFQVKTVKEIDASIPRFILEMTRN